MALENESPKEFLFWVLEDLSQDFGFWSIIYVIYHVTLQKLWAHNKGNLQNHCQAYNFSPQCFIVNSLGPQYVKKGPFYLLLTRLFAKPHDKSHELWTKNKSSSYYLC